MEIGEFLEARFAEEEADARAAQGRTTWSGPWTIADDPEPGRVRVLASSVPQSADPPILRIPNLSPSIAAHIARQDPAATLARVEALRTMLRVHQETSGWGPDSSWPAEPYALWKCLAAIWSCHPDYRAEWALPA